MTGFLYLKLPAGFELPESEQLAPPGAALAWSLQGGDLREFLWTWGGAGGDVWVGTRGDGDVAVLSGYVAALRDGPVFRTQSEAVRFLLDSAEGVSGFEHWRNIASRAYGSFSVLYRPNASRRIVCLTDRVASRPLWVHRRAGVTAVSTHSSAIAAALKLAAFDKGSLASLLLYAGPMDPRRSLFEGVSGVSAGTLVELRDGAPAEEHRWYTFRHLPDDGLSRKEWARLAADRLVAAAGRILRLNEAPTVFFSGGTDSRLAAAAMKAAGGSPLLVTLSDSINMEVRVARRAARALGLPHQVLLRDQLWYLRGLRRAVFESAGSFLWTHAHFSQAAAKIAAGRPGASFMLGDLCEAFSKLCCSVEAAVCSPLTAERFSSQFDRLPLPLYQPLDRTASLSLLRCEAREEAVASLDLSLANRYAELRPGTMDPAIFTDQFLRWDQVGTIATFFMFLDLRSAGPDRNLMLDPDMHGLLEVLPAEVRNRANFGATLIANLWPPAARAPNSNSLLPMCFPPLAHRLTKACKPLLGRFRRWWMGNPYTTTGSWPSRHVLYLGEPVWRGYIEGVIKEAESLDSSVFDYAAIRQAWVELANGNSLRAADVEKVILLTELTRMLKTGVRRYLEQPHEGPVDAGCAGLVVSERSERRTGEMQIPVPNGG